MKSVDDTFGVIHSCNPFEHAPKFADHIEQESYLRHGETAPSEELKEDKREIS
jgi:hypothetical protein